MNFDKIKQEEMAMKMKQSMAINNIQYNGRMSPAGKEELYRYYLNGMTIKDLSLKYGILP